MIKFHAEWRKVHPLRTIKKRVHLEGFSASDFFMWIYFFRVEVSDVNGMIDKINREIAIIESQYKDQQMDFNSKVRIF